MNVSKPLVVASLALLGAGCGSAGPSSRSSTGQSSSDNPAAAAFKYADCMRSHGVSGFPDPRVSSSPGHVSIAMVAPASLAGSRHFKSAQRACQGIMPSPGNAVRSDQPQRRQALLALARCLRAHGVSDFPDPNPQGQITSEMLSAARVDFRSHFFLQAALGCVGVTHGVITAAQIEAAISGPH